MHTTVKGVYKNGQIALIETPPDVEEAPVLVTFLTPNGTNADTASPLPDSRYIRFGQYSGPEDCMSTEEDFKLAEWGDDKIPEEFR